MDLTNRELAFLVWLAFFAAWGLGRRDTRESLADVLRSLRGKVAGLLAGYAIYIAVAVLIAQRLGLWNVGLLTETIGWFLLPGLVLLFGFTRVHKERNYYWRTLVSVIGLAAAIEFYVNLAEFPLAVELLLLPALVLLAALSALAGLKSETRPAKRFVDALLTIVGVAILVGTGVWLADHWNTLDKTELALSFALPIWLTLVVLPFVILLSLYASYETTFARIDHATKDDPQARRRAKVALIGSFHVKNRGLHGFDGLAALELAEAKSWGEARRIIAYHRAEARLREANEDFLAKKVARYAGVPGTDWEGHPLDQREFAATKDALGLLATFHRAQHANGRYRADLMGAVNGLLISTELPDPDIVMTVKKNGRAWYAWRRTVGGWNLGIGAKRAPPDQWAYEGEEPPRGFPNKAEGWWRGTFDERENDAEEEQENEEDED
jgi:hypothetical protein